MDRPPLPSPPSAIAFTVFVDSNLNTHIAMAVSPGDSVADFKRKIRIEHELCFPDVGDISVQALKVKRRGAFYHLSDTMLVSSAFEGTKGTCFLHVDVVVTSISKNQGGTAEHFLTDRRERFAGNRQLLLGASKNLDNDRPHEKQSVFADGVDLSEPKSFSCLIENHKDTLNDPLDDRFHNGNESTHLHHHKRPGVDKEKQLRESDSRLKEAVEMPLVPNSNLFVNQVKDVREKKLPGLEAFDNRSPTTAPKEGESLKNNDIEPNSCLINANPGNNFVENKMGEEKTTTVEKPVEVNAAVFNDGGLNYVNEISNLEKNPGEVQLGTDVGNLAYPEQSLTILADGDSCLIGHLTEDKKKRKKKKRPAKCQQTEVDLSMPLNGNITISPHSGKVKNIEHEHALEESDPIDLVSEVMDGSNEATMLINFKQLTEKVDGGVEQVSRNVADEDSVVVNFSNKKDASDVNSMNMAKGSHSKSISNVDRKAVDADFNTDNVNMPCPKELSEKLPDGGSNLIDHLMDDKKKKKSRRRSSKSQQNEFDFAKPLSDQIAILPQSYEVHKIDLGAAIEKNDAICSEPKSQAGNNEGTGNSHRDMTNKFHDGTDRASENVVDGDSLAVVTSSEKIGVSDFSSVRMAKDLDSYLVSSIDGMATETVKVKAASDDIHNELNTKSIVSSIITEPALLGNPAADASHSPNNFHRKKRSKKSSEKVLSSKYSVHSSEFTNEENPEEKHGIDFEGMDKESGLAINKDSVVVNFSNKKDASDVNSMNMAKGSHSKSISNVDRKAVDADFNTDNVNMPCPKELSEKLPDGGSNLIDHLMDDKKKKKSRRRSSKSQQNEFDFAKPLSDQIAILPQSYEVHKIDLGAAIEKNDAICSEPKSQAGNNEGTGNSHRDMTNKFHDGTDRASENVVDGDSLAVVTSSEKIGVSDFSSVRMAKDLDSYLVSSIDGMATETVKVKAASDDIHNELNTKSIVSSIITEPALLGNPAADASHSPNNFHRKKRSKKSSEKVLSSKYSVHSSEFTNEENPEEKHGIDFEGMDKESGLAINKDSLSQRDSTNLGSIDPTANVGSSHRKRRKKSEKAGSNNLQANICEPIHSLVNQANKDNHKEKLDDQDRQDLISLAEVNVLADCAVPTSELPAKSDYTKSDRKKKRSSKIELQDEQATQEELSEGLVKEPAEDTAKKLLNNHNKEPNKSSYSFDNHNESAVLGGSEVDLVISVSANEKGAVRHKKKSAKSRSSGKRMSNCDIAHSIEDQSTPGNFENTTAGDEHPGGVSIVDALTNEALPNASHENLGEEHTTRMTNRGTKELVDASKCGGLPNDDNDKINFHDVFCPSSVQHGPIVSSNELLAAEAESKKQHKSKRKRKSSKHGATHDLGYPSESVKQRITESEHPNDELYSRSINNDSVKHTTDDSMNHAATFSNFMSPQNSNDSKVKVKIQDRKPDALHQQSLNLQEQSKHVISEKIFSRSTSAHEVLNQSKATAVTSYKKPPLDPAASSASLEDDTPIQAKSYRVAARKVPSRSSGRKLDNDNRNSAVLTSSAIFNAATSDDSEDEFELRARISTKGAASDTSSASSDSDEDLDNMQKIGSTSVANGGKDNGIDGEDIALSQLSRSRPLDAILRSSNSYKKAKLLASQSQAEDSDSQPVDVVLETQPEPDI